jgi:hypothetical protein
MEELSKFICEFIMDYFTYIILAIMLGFNKAVYEIESKNVPFTISNILKYGIIYSIIAPLKIGFDIKRQINKHSKLNNKKINS